MFGLTLGSLGGDGSALFAPALDIDFTTGTLDPRITITRASSGTYFDSAGVLQRATYNLLTYSEQFNNAVWAKATGTVSANAAVSPDGTLSADAFIPNNGAAPGSYLAQNINTTSGVVYTFSFFAKAAGFTTVRCPTNGTAFLANVEFNLLTGISTTLSGTVTHSMTNVGNGWYRCQMTETAADSSLSGKQIRIPTTGDGTSGIYVWGAQLEQASTAGPYYATTASANGAPRFDYNPTTLAARGLLIEEQRANLQTYSEQFDNAAWVVADATVSANAAVAPDGNTTADKLVETTSNSGHSISGAAPTSGQAQTFSVFAKAAERSRLNLSGGGFTGQGFAAQFDLSNGTIAVNNGNKASITPVGNGWYRCSISFTPSNTVAFQIQLANDSGSTSYTGNGASGVYLWGAQVENGTFATSYIPTTGAQATRAADSAVMTGTNFSSWYNATEGTLFAESQTAQAYAAGVPARASIDDGTTSNRVVLRNGNNFWGTVSVSGSAVASLETVAWNANVNKQAIAFKANDFAYTTNGVAVQTDTSGAVPTVNRLTIGLTGSQNWLNGHIRRIAYYRQRLPNAQLQAITA